MNYSTPASKQAMVEFSYHWLPMRCLRCAKWGHVEKAYLKNGDPKEVNKAVENAGAVDNVVEDSGAVNNVVENAGAVNSVVEDAGVVIVGEGLEETCGEAVNAGSNEEVAVNAGVAVDGVSLKEVEAESLSKSLPSVDGVEEGEWSKVSPSRGTQSK